MDDEWYVAHNGQPIGPYTLNALRQFVREGRVTATDLVSRPGAPSWIPAQQVQELRDVFPPIAARPPLPPIPATPAVVFAPNQPPVPITTGMPPGAPRDVLGDALIAVPIVTGTFLAMGAPGVLFGVMLVTTAVLIGVDAQRHKMPTVSHVVGALILWIVAYPFHLRERGKFGAPSRFGLSLVAMAILFVGLLVGTTVMGGGTSNTVSPANTSSTSSSPPFDFGRLALEHDQYVGSIQTCSVTSTITDLIAAGPGSFGSECMNVAAWRGLNCGSAGVLLTFPRGTSATTAMSVGAGNVIRVRILPCTVGGSPVVEYGDPISRP